MNVQVETYGLTDIGRRRKTNEDQFLIAELSGSMEVHHTSLPIEDCSTIFGSTQGHLFLVADGLGGHAAGERASALAVSAVSRYAVNRLQLLGCASDSEEAAEELQSIAAECQRRLEKSAQRHPDEHGMATTLTLAIVIWPKLFLMHVGDSRCYLLRNHTLELLTRDHTIGQLYAEFGDDIAPSNEAKNALWNVVSSTSEADLVADVVQRELELGDRLILCTDGLYNHLDAGMLREVAARDGNCEAICQELVGLANGDGGSDNITVIVSRFISVPQSDLAEPMVETRVPLKSVFEKKSDFELHDTDDFELSEIRSANAQGGG